MGIKYSKMIGVSLVLSLNLYAQNSFTLEKQSLENAIKQIALKSKMSYIADGKLLKGKLSKEIKDIKGVQNALEKVLLNTNLKAVIKNNVIVIIKKEEKQNLKDNNLTKKSLGEVEVYGDWLGNSKEEAVKDYSGARTIITSKTLQKVAAKNLEDTLRVVPGVQIQDETGTGVLPNISLRGLKPGRSAYLNALVNGVPAAIAPYSHASFSLFPITMETLESIDVVRGGAAVHYGPNNVGGVVNFITKPISTEHSSTIKNKIDFADNGNILNDIYLRTGGFVNNDLGLQLQVNSINGESFREHSQTDITNIILDSEYYPNDNSELKANIQYYDADADLPGALLPEAYEKDKSKSQRIFDKFEGETTRASLRYKLNPNENSEFNWINFAHKSKRKFQWGWNTTGLGFTPAQEDSLRTADREIVVLGTEPRWTYEKSNHKFTVGARYVREDVDYLLDQKKFSSNLTNTIRDWKIKTDAIATYVSDTISLMNGDLKVTPGLRYEMVDTDFGDNINSNPNADKKKNMRSWLPGLSIGYQANKELFLFTNAQRSLRAPQVAQVRKDGDLAAELAWNYEVGLRYTPNDIFSMNSTLYRIDYEDQIEYISSTQSFKNLGETRHQGIETQIVLKPTNQTALTLGYTYLDTEQLTGANKGKKLPGVSTHQLSVSGDYSISNNDFNITGVYLSDAFSDSANTKEESANGQKGKVPSYMLWNAKYSRMIPLDNKLDAKVSFAVNNIFDEDYYFRGVDVSPVGRVPGQGRSFSLAFQLDF